MWASQPRNPRELAPAQVGVAHVFQPQNLRELNKLDSIEILQLLQLQLLQAFHTELWLLSLQNDKIELHPFASLSHAPPLDPAGGFRPRSSLSQNPQ